MEPESKVRDLKGAFSRGGNNMVYEISPQTIKAPKEVHGFFAGPIDQQAVQRVTNALTIATNNGVDEIHLLFQTTGGIVGDGICIYNVFRTSPVRISLYNAGSVTSIGVVAYLGAGKRKSSTRATFMIHRTYFSPVGATSDRLQAAANTAILDDQRIEAILHSHVTLPQEKWDIHNVADLWLSADEALEAKLATEIDEFTPPKGEQLFYLGPP
jgi:ATP-dependent Clp protease, protease subunit